MNERHQRKYKNIKNIKKVIDIIKIICYNVFVLDEKVINNLSYILSKNCPTQRIARGR